MSRRALRGCEWSNWEAWNNAEWTGNHQPDVEWQDSGGGYGTVGFGDLLHLQQYNSRMDQNKTKTNKWGCIYSPNSSLSLHQQGEILCVWNMDVTQEVMNRVLWNVLCERDLTHKTLHDCKYLMWRLYLLVADTRLCFIPVQSIHSPTRPLFSNTGKRYLSYVFCLFVSSLDLNPVLEARGMNVIT